MLVFRGKFTSSVNVLPIIVTFFLCIICSDVLGLAITKKSWETGQRTIDLYLMNDNGYYTYMYEIRALELEYEPVRLSRQGNKVQTQLSVSCTHFKRILHDCQKQGEWLSFERSYNPKTNMIETILRPTGDSLNSTRLKLVLFNAAPADFDRKKYKFEISQQYSISSLQLFTKATPMCKNVEIFISDDFPLIVQYLIGDLGTLRFLLASRIPDSGWNDASTSPARDKRKRFELNSDRAQPAEVNALVASLTESPKRRKLRTTRQ